MIVVRITGGLGNQMFQFAFARVLQEKGNNICIQWHGHRAKFRHNGWELDEVFQAPLSSKIRATNNSLPLNLNAWYLRKTRRKREPSNIGYNPEFIKCTSGYIDGYWQTEKYFLKIADTIRKDFIFKPLSGSKNQKLLDQLQSESCISIHVRRGDYVNHPGLGDVCTPDYYSKALEHIQSKVPACTLILFSDDMTYSKDLLSEHRHIAVDWNSGADSWMDMALMAQCKHHIIANSSFSWWGAWLGISDGITVGPAKWFSDTVDVTNPDILPLQWISL